MVGVELDGSSVYWSATKALATASKTGTIAILFNPGDVASAQALFNITTSGGSTRLGLSISSAAELVLVGRNSGGSTILSATTSGLGLTASTWYFVHAAFDLEAGDAYIFVNDTDETPDSPTVTDDDLDLNHPSWVGAANEANFYDGVLDYVFFSTAYSDPSVEANRRKFYGESGSQAGLGASGSYPLGVTPELLLNGGAGNFGTNRGSGASLTAAGAPVRATGRPPAVETLSRGFRGETWRRSERSGIPFPESELVIESASGLLVARREWSTDRDEINRQRRLNNVDGEF